MFDKLKKKVSSLKVDVLSRLSAESQRLVSKTPTPTSSPEKELNGLQNIAGTWEYICVLSDDATFPEDPLGGNAHGGICNFKVTQGSCSTEVFVRGERKWNGTVKPDKNEQHKISKEQEWFSYEGVYMNCDSVEYKYYLQAEHPISGVSKLRAEIDEHGQIFWEGKFYYYFVHGALTSTENVQVPEANDLYKEWLLNRKAKNYLQMQGKITLTKLKK